MECALDMEPTVANAEGRIAQMIKVVNVDAVKELVVVPNVESVNHVEMSRVAVLR